MPIIETRRPDIAALTGLHLWHAGMSNCSQRVRLVLEEKSLAWASHLIDLFAFEHASAEYQSIHPKGLVPALVHDGRTIVDSNDIIRYLDHAFPDPTLAPTADNADPLLDLADASQQALRTVSHELMLGEVRRLDQATLDMFEREHGNREFFEFLRRFSTEGFDDAYLAGCLDTLDAALTLLETRLERDEWLAGDAFSLLDISWVVNVHRLLRIGFPLGRFPRLSAWVAKIKTRPAYERGLLAWETQVPASEDLKKRRKRLYKRYVPSRGLHGTVRLKHFPNHFPSM